MSNRLIKSVVCVFYNICWQTGQSRMAWSLRNSSNDPGEMAWVVSPTTDGTIEPFGEVVVEVVAQTTGLSARQKLMLYGASFILMTSASVAISRWR